MIFTDALIVSILIGWAVLGGNVSRTFDRSELASKRIQGK